MFAAVRRYCFRVVIFIVLTVGLFDWSDSAIAEPLLREIILPNTIRLADLQMPRFTERSATLVSPRENSAIALYIRPAPNQQPVGYGMSGDAVTVTDQFGDYLMEDDPSATWSRIRLEKPPYTEGWLRGRFLSIPSE